MLPPGLNLFSVTVYWSQQEPAYCSQTTHCELQMRAESTTHRAPSLRLRAACALAALLLSWASLQAAVISYSPDVCSMACCVQEGHCCCSPPRASVAGQRSDDNPHFTQADLSSPCPNECTAPYLSSSSRLQPLVRHNYHQVDFCASPVVYSERFSETHNSITSQPSAPRGPPVLSSLQA